MDSGRAAASIDAIDDERHELFALACFFLCPVLAFSWRDGHCVDVVELGEGDGKGNATILYYTSTWLHACSNSAGLLVASFARTEEAWIHKKRWQVGRCQGRIYIALPPCLLACCCMVTPPLCMDLHLLRFAPTHTIELESL